MKYISDRSFQMFGYTGAHSFLLLRSPMLYPDLEGYSDQTNFNLDIEFWGVSYMDIPTNFKRITISILENGINEKIFKHINTYNSKIFELRCDGEVFYVVAAGFLVGVNRWVSENRITNPLLNYEKIIFNL